MGFLAKAFGVKSSKPKLLAPQLEPEAKEFQAELYPRLTSGLQGRGLTPDIDAATRQRMFGELETAFPETRRDLGSFISRTIPRADIGVRGFLKKSLAAQFARQKESIGRDFEFKGFEDLGRAQNLAFGAVDEERRVAGDIAGATNLSILRRSLSPDFESALAGGLGGAAGIGLAGGFGQTGGANTMTGSNVRYSQSLDPRFTGSSYFSNFSSADFTTPSPIRYAEGFSSP